MVDKIECQGRYLLGYYEDDHIERKSDASTLCYNAHKRLWHWQKHLHTEAHQWQRWFRV